LGLLLFFFNLRPPPHSYALSLHDALPIYPARFERRPNLAVSIIANGDVESERFDDYRKAASEQAAAYQDVTTLYIGDRLDVEPRSEEHTSELQSRENLVCRLLLEKKKNQT